MSKVREGISESKMGNSDTKYHDRSGPHESPFFANNKNAAKPSLQNLKAASEGALFMAPDNVAIQEKLSKKAGALSANSSRLEFVFYKVFLCLFFLTYACFRYFQYTVNKIKIHVLNIAYSPSNTPQLIRQDVLKLSKLPKRLAAILEIKSEGDVGGGVSGLINDGSDLVAWSVSAGIKHLTLYDFDGYLKKNVHEFREGVHHKLSKYYDPSNVPKFAVRVPQWNSVYYNSSSTEFNGTSTKKVAIEISLLSNRDGRETIVDLTRTMAELCTNNEMKLADVTMKLIDSELLQLVGPEPDLLLYFGPRLDLQGFPPWHIRLTEFYWEEDNDQVTYSVFIRGLKTYSACKVNVGK
ncbi:LAMI_0E11540g1_1 [Lachancea mirantina]|uniref:ditrans,polycis-polyprenyl diphosphate synthase [(2E,6E)-farnesyldiphosphate specific] n=1 Tax=Lachancea mirantina TaxID=1230905 RepID=A0A1G4JPI9_9SACH|nr:LAMI_0E11540g1_1 [Lachancea mirantina]